MKALLTTATILALLLTKVCSAHSNKELQMDEAGYIQGVPEYVQPVKFDVADRKFQVKNLEILVPECMDQYLAGVLQGIRGTWFHHQTNEPPHVIFTWSGADNNVFYNVPFSLISAKPMYVVETTSPGQPLDEGRRIEIGSACQKSIDHSLNEIDP